jgi:hypothetical protein
MTSKNTQPRQTAVRAAYIYACNAVYLRRAEFSRMTFPDDPGAEFDAWLEEHDASVRKEALYEAQDAIRGEDTRDWARRAYGSSISLPEAMRLVDDLIEEGE